MKVTLSSFIVAIGLCSMAAASPLHHAVRRQEGGSSSSTESVPNFGIWHHNHTGTRPHKPTGSHTTDNGIRAVQTQTVLTQAGPTLVNRDDATTSPSPTTVADFRPREFTGYDTHKFTGIPKPSVTWSPTRSRTRSHQPSPTYTSYAHVNPPPKPTGPIARDLGDQSDDGLWFAKEKELEEQATKHASQSHLNRREESYNPDDWETVTQVVQSYYTHHATVTGTQYVAISGQYTTTSSPPPPPPPTSSTKTTAPTATLTSKSPPTPPTIESKTPVCPSAGNNIWCLGGQTFYLECDTDHNGGDIGSVNLSPQNWDMYGRCGALCAAVPDQRCTGFSYVWGSGMCYLKEGENAKKSDGGKHMEGTHAGRVVKLKEEEVGNCLGVNPRVGQYMGLSEGVRRRDHLGGLGVGEEMEEMEGTEEKE